MISGRSNRFLSQSFAFWKQCLSFFKRDWQLSDYPVLIHVKEFDPEFAAPRFKQHRYIASIVNWTLSGSGATRQEALQDLAANFEATKTERKRQGRNLPRPGTSAPIEFASQRRVGTHSELAQDFIQCILGLDWAWISDESSLWDFHTNQTNDDCNFKIKEIYGVDVSDIQSANLADILERIASERASEA